MIHAHVPESALVETYLVAEARVVNPALAYDRLPSPEYLDKTYPNYTLALGWLVDMFDLLPSVS